MKILYRYIFKQFSKAFIFTSTAFVFLFILINMVEHLDQLMDKKLNLGQIAGYYTLLIPSTLLVTSPVSALLSSIMVSGRLSASSELPAIRSAGVSMGQFLNPFFIAALLICTINILNSCWIAPAAFASKERFEKHYFGKNLKRQYEKRNIHILERGNRIVSIESINPEKSSTGIVSIEEFNGAHLTSRIDAASMSYNSFDKNWVLQKAATRFFIGEDEYFSLMNVKPVKLDLSPRSLKELNLLPDEMNIIRHYQYLSEKQAAGFSGLEQALVKFHTKLSLPFASIIVMLIGVPLSAKKKRGGLASEISISLFTGFLFIGLQKTIAIAGYQGVISPILAAWLPNIIFLCIGYVIYKTVTD
ncbi:MAG: LPS export ABC transporter permease LptG [Chlorobiaceae bacterium]